MPDQDGVEIYKRFYPWPDRFRLGDPVLVKEVTNMTWPEFVAALDEQDASYERARESGADPPEPDQVVLAGLIAVAFWQGNKQMTRDKARRAIEMVPIDDIEFIGGEEDAEPRPPEVRAGALPSTISSESGVSQEVPVSTGMPPVSTWDETNPNGSGSPGLPSQHPESLQA